LSLARRILSIIAALAAIVGPTACGGGVHDEVAVRIGDTTISKSTVDHWISVMAPEHVAPDPPRYNACIARQQSFSPQAPAAGFEQECRQQYEGLRLRALDLLISSQWLIGEATARGVEPSDQEVASGLAASGALAGAGGTDASPTMRSKLAAAALREALTKNEAKVSDAEVAAYYRGHIQQFERPEKRFFALFEPLADEQAARTAMRAVAQGRDRAKLAVPESLVYAKAADVVPWKRGIERAIFAAKPHVLVGPLPLRRIWCFFEVTHVTPRVVKPMAKVHDAIVRQLEEQRQRRTLAGFISRWREKWIAMTDCSPAYVVQKCRQYRGTKAPEDPLAFN
jgi:PPIC-type PPIASE domain